MTTFDDILPKLTDIFQRHAAPIAGIAPILLNRDLNGRLRLIVDEKRENDSATESLLRQIALEIHDAIGPHAYPVRNAILYDAGIDLSSAFPLDGCENIFVVDRLASEGDWTKISPESKIPRIVFFSIKGGVGRSTALAATAWALAEQGKKVLVLDLDLESPGLSSSLLPADRQPGFGITDWLVEDLVDNGAAVFTDMVATSDLSRNGEILVVPAHGREPGEYIAKLGRIWMPKVASDGSRESWSERLRRLIDGLEERCSPDVVLLDSRAGIDEVASACVTGLGAATVLLFAIDGDQTWAGYRILFQHWHRTGVVREIRERLQVVGTMIPETEAVEYFAGLLERAWDVFSEELYDEVPAGTVPVEGEIWSFDKSEESAPHFPWAVRWHRSLAALRSLHGKLPELGLGEATTIFGPLIDGVVRSLENVPGTT